MRYLLLALLLTACGGSQDPVCTVEINADSVMSGSAQLEPAAVVLKQIRPDWVVDDRAVSGLTLNTLSATFKQVTHQPVVVIELGGNDAYEGRAPEQFEAQLTDAVQHLITTGKTPVLTGIVQVETWGAFDAAASERVRAFDAITVKVAAQTGIRHAGWGAVPAQTVDGVHPTKERRDILITLLATTLDEVCL